MAKELKKVDFNIITNRRNTNCLKYDFAKRRGKPEDILPLWIADMDFKAPKEVTDALHNRVEHGIFGYSEVQEEYFEAVHSWMVSKHNWDVKRDWLVKTPSVVFALAMAVKAFTKVGDGVMIQQPVYYPFSEVILDNDRKIIDNTLVLGNDGKYHIDFEDFENKVREHKVKLFLLCSPHNPVGRVWTIEELERLGDICNKYDVIVVSDEIHQDFVFKGKHQVFANINGELANRTITCTAPSKTFNLAGLQISNIFISNKKLKSKFRKQIDAAGYSQLNVLGLTACEAAYRHGENWHNDLLHYLKENILFLNQFINEKIPEIKVIEPEGTYLIWLDFRGLGLTEGEREDLIVNQAGLWLDSGAVFGKAGEGFERINVACPKEILEIALKKLEESVKKQTLGRT